MVHVLVRKSAVLLFLAVALLAGWAAAMNFAPAAEAWRLLTAGDDPVAVSDALLDRALTPATFSAQLDAALDSGDADLAESFRELGRERGLAPSAAQSARLAALRAGDGDNAVREFGRGFAYGERDTGAAFAGALAGDLSGYGDLRDLWNEGRKVARGEKADELVVGLAAVGLVLSAATVASVAAVVPARAGLTLVKSAQKTGRMSRPLAAALRRAAAGAIDREALAATFSAAAKLDLAASRAAAGRIARSGASFFRALGQDAATIFRRAGARGATQALAMAESGAEMRRAARLAAVKGFGTRAILVTLGRAALVAGSLAVTAAHALFAFVLSLVGLAVLAQRFGFWLGRLRLWPRRSRAPQAG